MYLTLTYRIIPFECREIQTELTDNIMSFQDVGRKGGRGGRSAQRGRRPVTSGVSSTSMSSPNMDNSSAASKERSGLYSQASDSILQYQKNVGLLENMYRQIGTRADGPVLETQ